MQKCNYGSHLVHPIVDFVSGCRGLSFLESDAGELIIYQRIDGKSLTIKIQSILEVIPREDAKKEKFLQINFSDNKKIILTDSLIGFKPISYSDLDMNRLPKVVTTPDLISFVEVLEESFYDATTGMDEIEDVKKYFNAVLMGGEDVGFNLVCERVWAAQLLNHQISIGND